MPIDAGLQASIDSLVAQVTATDGVIASATTALSGSTAIISNLTAQLAAAVAANDPTAIAAASKSLTDAVTALNTNTAALAFTDPAATLKCQIILFGK